MADRPSLQLPEFFIREKRDGFLFLAWLHVQVHSAVMVFAELLVERANQFAEGFAVPGHEFRQEKGGNGSVAFRQVKAGADATAFFTANQNILLQHQFADVLEADGHLVKLAIESGGKFVDELGDRERFGDVTRQIAFTNQVPDQQGKDVVGIGKGAIAIDCADAVAVTISSQASVVFSGKHRLPQRLDVGLNRLRMNAAEASITVSANFVADNAVPGEEFTQGARSGTVHRV